jgi:hypothetical protein
MSHLSTVAFDSTVANSGFSAGFYSVGDVADNAVDLLLHAFVDDFRSSKYCGNAALVNAVIGQIGFVQFANAAHDITCHSGEDVLASVRGLINIDFAVRNYQLIATQIKSDSVDMGIPVFLDISDFTATRHDKPDAFWNNLAWYAAEVVSRWYADFVDNVVGLTH